MLLICARSHKEFEARTLQHTVGTPSTSSLPKREQGRVHPQHGHAAQHCQGCLERKASSHLLVSVLILPATSQSLFLDTRTAQTCHPLPSCTCTCSKPCMAITLPPTGCHALGSWPGGWADLGCAGRISLALCHPHGSCRVPPTVCLRFNCPFAEFYIPFSFCLHFLPPLHLPFSKTALNPLAAVFIMFLQQTHLSKAFGHCNLSSSNCYTWPRASVIQYLLFNWYHLQLSQSFTFPEKGNFNAHALLSKWPFHPECPCCLHTARTKFRKLLKEVLRYFH